MTINVEQTIVTHQGNGSAREFSFGFTVPDDSSQIRVFTVNPSGVETERMEGLGARSWSVNIPGDGYPATGGSITYPSNGAYRLPAGHKLVIKRILRFEQGLDLPTFGAYNPESLERQLDRQVMLAQQNHDLLTSDGAGGVTRETFDDEQERRIAGDDLQSIQVATLLQLETALNAQNTADTALEIVFTADVTYTSDTYRRGDVVYVRPRSIAIERRFNVGAGADETARAAAAVNTRKITALENLRFAAELKVYPANIEGPGSIRQAYTFVLENEQQDMLFDNHTSAPINRIRIRERNSGAVVHEEAWSYSSNDWVFRGDINAAEANAIGSLGSAEFFEMRAEFGRGSGGSFTLLETSDWFRITVGSWFEAPATLGDVRHRLNLMVRASPSHIDKNNIPARILFSVVNQNGAFPDADRVRIVMFGRTRDFTGYKPAVHEQSFAWDLSAADRALVGRLAAGTVHGVQVTLRSATTNYALQEIDFEVTEVATGSASALTQKQQIGLLQMAVRPTAIVYDQGSDADATASALEAALRPSGGIFVRIANAELLSGDIWVEGRVQGVLSLARTKWTAATSGLALTPGTSNVEVIAAAVISNDDDTLQLDLRFYDAANAGNLVEVLELDIPVVQRPVAGDGSGNDATARAAAAAAQAAADAATTPAEATTIANQRARARYTDAEKTKLAGLANFNPNTIDGVSGGDVRQIDNARTAGFQGLSVWYGTKAQYDAITNKSASTIYFFPPA